MSKKRALILGAGQDGSYTCELLLEKGCEVHLLHRRSSVDNLRRVRHLLDRITLHRGDMTDTRSIERAVTEAFPHELYCLADQDDANWSREIPEHSWDVTSGGMLRVLEIVKSTHPAIRVFFPASVLVFGKAPPPQNEETPLDPRSPYACAKAAALHLCRHYRKDHGVWVACGIMGNHDSPNRSEDYVLHKIVKAAVRIARGEQKTVALGNLDQRFDVGYAKDCMEAAWLMLQADLPDDWCVGTGVAKSIKQICDHAFHLAGLRYDVYPHRWEKYVTRDERFWKPADHHCCVDASKIRRQLGWEPRTTVDELIRLMVEEEMKR